MTQEEFITQLEEEYPEIRYNDNDLITYLAQCEAEGIEPWTAGFAEYWAISF